MAEPDYVPGENMFERWGRRLGIIPETRQAPPAPTAEHPWQKHDPAWTGSQRTAIDVGRAPQPLEPRPAPGPRFHDTGGPGGVSPPFDQTEPQGASPASPRPPTEKPTARYGAKEIEYPNPLPPNWRAGMPTQDNRSQWVGAGELGRPPEDRSQWVGAGERPLEGEEGADDPMKSGGAPGYESVSATGEGGEEGPDDPMKRGARGLPGPPAKAAPAGKGGGAGGGGKGGAGAIKTDEPWKALRDQTRTAAFDRSKDLLDPHHMHHTADQEGRPSSFAYPSKPPVITEAEIARGGQPAKNEYTGMLAGAVKFVTEMFHQGKPDQHTNEGYHALTFQAAGAPDDDVMRSVYAVVDPKGELPFNKRHELATKAMYDFYMSNGNEAAANKVAGESLQYGNKMAKGYGEQAIKELQAGNKEAAVNHIKTAYGWLPDGYSADVEGNSLKVSDRQGTVLQTIPLDDKSIQNVSLGLATGTLYWDVVQQRAGQRTFGPPKPQQAAALPGQAVATAPPTSAPPSAPAPVTPPSNQPAAPPPAAAGPAPTPQAEIPQGDGGPPGSPASGGMLPPSMPKSTTFIPPPGEEPVTPTQAMETKPPAKAPAAPAATPAAKPAAAAAAAEGAKPPAAKPGQVELVWDDKDPDTVPKWGGKEERVYRRTNVDPTPEVRQAGQQFHTVTQKYLSDKDWIVTQAGKSKSKVYSNTLSAMKQTLDKEYDTQRQAYDKTISEHNQRRVANDTQEKQALMPERLKGQDLLVEQDNIDKQFKNYVAQGEKWAPYKANPLRLYNTPEKWAPIREMVLEVQAHNKEVSVAKVADAVLTAMTHVETGEIGKSQSANRHDGEKGSRFVVVGKDLRNNPVISIGAGNSEIVLHVPRHTLADLKRLKTESFKEKNKPVEKKPGTDWGALVPDQTRKTIKDLGEVIDTARQDAKEQGITMPPKPETKPDDPAALQRARDARRRGAQMPQPEP